PPAGSYIRSPDSLTTNLLTEVSLSPVWSSDGSTSTGRSSMTFDSTVEFDARNIADPVLEPMRLKRILESIVISWDLEVVSRCLRKDIVFRTSTPPKHGLPDEACSPEHLRKIQVFA